MSLILKPAAFQDVLARYTEISFVTYLHVFDHFVKIKSVAEIHLVHGIHA